MFLSILTFFALVFPPQCHAFVTSMSRGVYQPNRTIIFDERTFRNPRLLYASCDSSKKCRLEHDREAFERPTDTCQINLKKDSVVDNIRVVPFGEDKAVLIWIENIEGDASFSLASVRFSDCSTHVVKSSFDYNRNLDFIFQPILASYRDFYDVVFVNYKLCGDNYCKMTVNFGTKEVRGPAAWVPINRDVLIADIMPLGSTGNGLLVVQLSGEILIIKGDAKKVLKQPESHSNASSATLSYSTSNNYIGICELTNNNLTCSQFNHSGSRTFESTFPIDSTANTKATYNLPGGGMLILLVKPTTNIRRVLKLDAHGIQAGVLDLGIRCSNPQVPAAHFFEKNNKYCVSLACFDNESRNKNTVEVAARCFSLSDIRAAWS